MNIKIGDKVQISQGIGEVVRMKPRKIPQGDDLSLPLVDGPNWDIGVKVYNPPGSIFPFFIYCAHAEYAKFV